MMLRLPEAEAEAEVTDLIWVPIRLGRIPNPTFQVLEVEDEQEADGLVDFLAGPG
jgi:hypothetical protein